jgi:hypothetical protein
MRRNGEEKIIMTAHRTGKADRPAVLVKNAAHTFYQSLNKTDIKYKTPLVYARLGRCGC